MDVMPLSDPVSGKTENLTATLNTPISPIGDKTNTSGSKPKRKHIQAIGKIKKKSLLLEAADGLASYLELYAKHGGEIGAFTLKSGKHVIVLPAEYDIESSTYSLAQIHDEPQ